MKPIPRETTIAALAIAITLLFILPLLILWNRPATVQTFQAPTYTQPYGHDDDDIDIHFGTAKTKPKVVYVPTPAPRTPVNLTKPSPRAVARTVNLTKAPPVRSKPARTSSSRRR